MRAVVEITSARALRALISGRKVRPLRDAEREAWQRWHRDMSVGEVMRFVLDGTFPVIRGREGNR